MTERGKEGLAAFAVVALGLMAFVLWLRSRSNPNAIPGPSSAGGEWLPIGNSGSIAWPQSAFTNTSFQSPPAQGQEQTQYLPLFGFIGTGQYWG